MTDHERRCERCGKRHLKAWIWLELDSYTNRFHEPGQLPADGLSQGLFPFGVDCAKKANEPKPPRLM